MSCAEKTSAVLFIDYSSIYETGKEMGKWVPFNIVLKNLLDRFGPIKSYVYVRNGHAKLAEFFANLGVEVVTCLANCDFIMGYDVSEVVRTLNPSTIMIASHDGGLRQVADRLERMGKHIVFLAHPTSRAFSTFLHAKTVVDIGELAKEEAQETLCEDSSGLPVAAFAANQTI